jgi:excisionase family DNA binding protein
MNRIITRRTPLADLPEMLRVEEAADWLGISKGLVYTMVRNGEIPHCKFGRLVRVPRAALAEMKAGKVTADTKAVVS